MTGLDRHPRHWSLAERLVLLTVLPALVVLALGGWWLRHEMQASLYAGMAHMLEDKAQRIAVRLEVQDGDTLQDLPSSGDEFSAIFSGWYWQVLRADRVVVARSRSLWDQPDLRPSPLPISARAQLYAATGPQQEALLAKTFTFQTRLAPQIRGQLGADAQNTPLATIAPTHWQLQVFGPADPLYANLRSIDRVLLATGGALLGLLLCLTVVQVRIGLEPLRRLVAAMAQLRQPTASTPPAQVQLERLPVGADLEALKQELLALLQRNTQIVARARSHAADLNHALKKPLSVLVAAASAQPTVCASTVLKQTHAMSRLIDRYQARTHSDALQTEWTQAGQWVDVQDCIGQLLAMMRQLHHVAELDWQLVWNAPTDTALLWRGERADLDEALGNLLDNAGKWAASIARVTVSIDAPGTAQPMLHICIEDDGPGLSQQQLHTAGARGLRFDENVEGSGLGLCITQQIAHSYGGSLTLEKSPALKGLQACLVLGGLVHTP